VKEREQVHATCASRLERLERKLDTLQAEAARQGAYLAQMTLLEYLQDDRYAHTPLNVANAMAGLPFIAWRTSAARCERIKRKPGAAYKEFHAVEKLLGWPVPKTAEDAIEQFREKLTRNRCAPSHPHAFLKKNWYHLRMAIETAYGSKPAKEALPYRIMADYKRRTSGLTAYDLLMEEEERLEP
jgi:hypothetical protein